MEESTSESLLQEQIEGLLLQKTAYHTKQDNMLYSAELESQSQMATGPGRGNTGELRSGEHS